jgi:hypothetical protein
MNNIYIITCRSKKIKCFSKNLLKISQYIKRLPNQTIKPAARAVPEAARATTIRGRLKNASTSATAVPRAAVTVFPVL